jgi:SEC-C motif
MADMLTDEDLEGLAHSAREGADPATVIAALLAAVDGDRLADPDDATYALSLAADIAEEHGDLQGALAHSQRALSAGGDNYHRATHARLLLLAGRDAEGMAILDELRPRMADDYMAAEGVLEALHESGRTEQAIEWSTAALGQAYPVWTGLGPDDPGYERATMVAFRLTALRANLRRELGLPEDDLDHRVSGLQAAVGELRREDEFDDTDAVMALFWPQADFVQLLARAPELSTVYGSDWDEHRSKVEGAMAMLSATGVPSLGLMEASLNDLSAFAAIRGSSITDEELRDEYAGTIDEILAWPPPRNLPCWCGSGQTYQTCCLPRAQLGGSVSDIRTTDTPSSI